MSTFRHSVAPPSSTGKGFGELLYSVVSTTQRERRAAVFEPLLFNMRGTGNTTAQLESVGSTTAVVEMGRGEKATLLPTRLCTAVAPDAFAGRFYDYPVKRLNVCVVC